MLSYGTVRQDARPRVFIAIGICRSASNTGGTALALAVATCTGLIMGWKYARRKSIVLLTLAAGVLIPAILVFV